MNKKSDFHLTVHFLVTIIICLVIFSLSIYIMKKFFTHAETIKMTFDERTEKEIERILDDGSKIAIPVDQKTIGNGEFKTFGIGILNIMSPRFEDRFSINISFNKAFDKRNNELCDIKKGNTINCGKPGTWLQTTQGIGGLSGVNITKTIKNNEQEKFLLGVNVKNAPSGTYIFDVMVCVEDRVSIVNNSIICPKDLPDPYDKLHKLYVDVP